MNEYSRRVIETFRANGGEVGGPYAGSTLLLLTSVGARSGRPHTTPLVYLADGERLVVFGTKGGAPTNPDWYYNLVANPDTTIELGTEEQTVRARVADEDERERIWGAQKAAFPQFAEYEKTSQGRTIPVVILERV